MEEPFHGKIRQLAKLKNLRTTPRKIRDIRHEHRI